MTEPRLGGRTHVFLQETWLRAQASFMQGRSGWLQDMTHGAKSQ